MIRKSLTCVASVGFITLLSASGASAQTSPSLGTAGTYSILAGTQVTNTGSSTVNGDVGISPGSGTAGTNHPGLTPAMVAGTIHDADAAALTAQGDKNTAYGALDQTCTTTYAGAFKELAGETLAPGVYCATSFRLSGGTLTLTGASGDTWIFKSSSDLIVSGGAAARVVSPSCNIWWRLVSSASLDANSSLAGNILADTAITLAAGATLSGRALARTAAVTLSSNAVSACTVPVPTLPQWAFIILAVLLAAAGVVAVRDRTPA